MSVVLYALGVILLLWGGYVLVTGDMIATLDIAATLMGYGAFVIGLGAITGAITRLARTLAEGAARAGEPRSADNSSPASPRRTPPLTAAAAPFFEPEQETRADPEPDHVSVPETLPVPPPRARPRIDIEAAVRAEPATAVEAPSPVSKAERRRGRAPETPTAPRSAAPEIEAPVVVAPLLGGGFARRDAVAEPAAALSAVSPSEPVPEPVVEPIALESSVEPVAASVREPDPATEPLTPTIDPAAKPNVAPPPEPASAPEPKVPEWLARARARREARAKSDDPAPSSAAPAMSASDEDRVVTDPPPASEEASEDVSAAVAAVPAMEAGEGRDSVRTVLREGEHNGVLYRFFEDGSVEAQSEHGMRRFASLEELRATILAVRGRIDDEEQTDVQARHEAELMVEERSAETVAEMTTTQEAAISPPNGGATEVGSPAPLTAVAQPEDDFEAALAALEGRTEAAPRTAGVILNPGEIRPSR